MTCSTGLIAFFAKFGWKGHTRKQLAGMQKNGGFEEEEDARLTGDRSSWPLPFHQHNGVQLQNCYLCNET
jgi:hypothetical protein